MAQVTNVTVHFEVFKSDFDGKYGHFILSW